MLFFKNFTQKNRFYLYKYVTLSKTDTNYINISSFFYVYVCLLIFMSVHHIEQKCLHLIYFDIVIYIF